MNKQHKIEISEKKETNKVSPKFTLVFSQGTFSKTYYREGNLKQSTPVSLNWREKRQNLEKAAAASICRTNYQGDYTEKGH
jgi:hypothetical protein